MSEIGVTSIFVIRGHEIMLGWLGGGGVFGIGRY